MPGGAATIARGGAPGACPIRAISQSKVCEWPKGHEHLSANLHPLNGSAMRIPPVLLSTVFSCALFAAAAAPLSASAQTSTDTLAPAATTTPAPVATDTPARPAAVEIVTCKDDRNVDVDKMIAACTAVIDNREA